MHFYFILLAWDYRADPISQLSWPPRDEYSSIEKERARRLREETQQGDGFTYSSGLNPELVRKHQDQRGGSNNWSSLPPYHPDYEPPEADEEFDYGGEVVVPDHHSLYNSRVYTGDDGEDEDDDEDIPLGIKYGYAAPNHGQSVHVRRGSEGYEVRPSVPINPVLPSQSSYLQDFQQESDHHAVLVDEDEDDVNDITDSDDDSLEGFDTVW